MSTPKRHHYLPESYLNRFARNGQFWVYDREENEFRIQTPNGTAVESYRYSMIDEAGNKDHSLEKQLAKMESDAIPGILKLDRGERLTAEDRISVAIFAAFLFTRVPDFEKLDLEFSERLAARFLAMAERGQPPGTPVPPEPDAPTLPPNAIWIRRADVEQFIDEVRERKVPRGNYFANMVGVGLDLAEVFYELDWVAAHPSKGKVFVCSDSPLVIFAPPGWPPDAPRGFGMRTRGTRKVVPLSASLALVMLDRGNRLAHHTLPEPAVRQVNEAVAGNCDRFVIARDEAHIRSLVGAAGLATRTKAPRIAPF